MPDQTLSAVVADDHELFRVALSELLINKLGFGDVNGVSSLDEALNWLGMRPDIRLALFDLQMPGMNGPACLEAVRRVFPELSVVIVSGSDRREDILAALEAGVHGYIPKSLSLHGMNEAIRSVLDGRIYVPASLAKLPPEASTEGRSPPLDADAGSLDNVELTARQREVLELLRRGRSNKEIARDLDLGAGTVKVHVAAVLRLLGVANRAGAAAAAEALARVNSARHDAPARAHP